jgi:hypothetical protein
VRGRGRKPDIDGLVERRVGSKEAKRKAKLLLRTFGEERTVIEAGRELGLNEGRAHVWRERALQAVVDAMEPRPAGRPREKAEPESADVARLEKRIAELEREIAVLRAREELAVLRGTSAEKKTASR